MKHALLLIPLLLFMTSCTMGGSDEKDAKIAELEKQITELKNISNPIIFERQKECLGYKSEIEELISGTNLAWKEGQERNGRNDYTHDEYFHEVFYSTKRNSCLYSTMVTEIQEGENCTFYKIYDYLSGNSNEIGMYLEFIKNSDGGIEDTCDYTASKNIYTIALKEFKGE